MYFRTQRNNTLNKHPLVTEVSDERLGSNNDGIWCYLKPGYRTIDGDHAVHEDTVAECRDKLSSVEPCECDSCKDEIARAAAKST